MLVEMLCSKDLYYAGELCNMADDTAQHLIRLNHAKPAECPDCGEHLQEAGGWIKCGADYGGCGYKRWRD